MHEPTLRTYQTRSGPMLALATDVYMARSLEAYGEYCPEEGRMLKQLIRPGMTVVEVGANMGTHSVDLARACAPGPFYAFEPQPRIFQVLCANLALNDIGNAFAYPDACGEVESEAVVPLMDYSTPGNFGGLSLKAAGEPGVTVRVRTIDSLNLAGCGLLKIDVEGFESQVLRGARGAIARHRPTIYVENDRAAQQAELISLIANMDYRLYWHTAGLFDPDNFNGFQEDIFGGVASLNMLCLPNELETTVKGLEQIDPSSWRSPIRMR